ncbi:MAG: hypothetical protein QGG73_11190 [Candidatus Hydrogenedentes bacterium]|nr:hypothetical protein [Candidatus Hydrogenedentota bacterium]
MTLPTGFVLWMITPAPVFVVIPASAVAVFDIRIATCDRDEPQVE